MLGSFNIDFVTVIRWTQEDVGRHAEEVVLKAAKAVLDAAKRFLDAAVLIAKGINTHLEVL
jgi:tellurite resistance protein